MSDAPTTPASTETVNAALIGCTDGFGYFDPSCPNPKYWVYFMSDGDAIKVGISDHPPKRYKQLQTGNPEKLRILNVVAFPCRQTAKRHEDLWKSQWAAYATNGGREWFRPPNAELKTALGDGSAYVVALRMFLESGGLPLNDDGTMDFCAAFDMVMEWLKTQQVVPRYPNAKLRDAGESGVEQH